MKTFWFSNLLWVSDSLHRFVLLRLVQIKSNWRRENLILSVSHQVASHKLLNRQYRYNWILTTVTIFFYLFVSQLLMFLLQRVIYLSDTKISDPFTWRKQSSTPGAMVRLLTPRSGREIDTPFLDPTIIFMWDLNQVSGRAEAKIWI